MGNSYDAWLKHAICLVKLARSEKLNDNGWQKNNCGMGNSNPAWLKHVIFMVKLAGSKKLV